MNDWPNTVDITGQGGIAPGEQRMVEAMTGKSFDDLKGADQTQAMVFIQLFRLLRDTDARFTPGHTDPDAIKALWEHAEWTELHGVEAEPPNLGAGNSSPDSLGFATTGT